MSGLSRKQKQWLRARLVDGRLRAVAGPLYALVVGAELAAERALDAAAPGPRAADDPRLDRLTAVIKTFERPASLRRLVRSIQRRYPGLRIVVVDDSREPARLKGVTTVTLPYDSGVSAGRSEGLRQVATPYMLNLDDDFVFTRHTGLAGALAVMERHPEIDILGGQVMTLPFYTRADYAAISFTAADRAAAPGSRRIGGLPVQAKVSNFFLARADRLRLVDWDPAVKRLDHHDFYRRASGILTSVSCPTLKCLHVPTPFDAEYMRIRTDYGPDAIALRRRQSA